MLVILSIQMNTKEKSRPSINKNIVSGQTKPLETHTCMSTTTRKNFIVHIRELIGKDKLKLCLREGPELGEEMIVVLNMKTSFINVY